MSFERWTATDELGSGVELETVATNRTLRREEVGCDGNNHHNMKGPSKSANSARSNHAL